MNISYEEVYDIISLVRIRLADDEFDQETVLDMVEQELQAREKESY